MKNMINFFFSFDKLMKHKLVPLFFWAALIYLAILFARDILQLAVFTEWIAWLTGWLEIIALVVMSFVGLRLVCELAISIFRISDNLAPDGGASDTADIDPLEETRRAAEEAAKRAREVTSKAVDKTKTAASNLNEKRKSDKADKTGETKADQVFDKPKPKSTTPKKTSTSTKTTAKKATSKKPATKTATKTGTTSKSKTTKKTTPKK